MCLQTISEKSPKKEGIGYKVFSRNRMMRGEDLLRGDCYVGARPIGVWLNAKKYANLPLPSLKYVRDWHIWATEKGAKAWVIRRSRWGSKHRKSLVVRKVEYKEAHTQGKQVGYKVIVAEEIRIIPIETQ